VLCPDFQSILPTFKVILLVPGKSIGHFVTFHRENAMAFQVRGLVCAFELGYDAGLLCGIFFERCSCACSL
jgi:hypothetical protein